MTRFTFNRQLAKRRAMFALLLVFAALLQNTRGVLPALGGARLLLLVPVCVAVSMREGSVVAMLFGVLGGSLCDYAAGGADGFYAAALSLVCFCCGALCSFLLRVNLRSFLLLCAGALAVVLLAHWLVFVRLPGLDAAGTVLLHRVVPAFFSTLLLSPLCYGAAKLCTHLTPMELIA